MHGLPPWQFSAGTRVRRYTVEIVPRAVKSIARLPRTEQQRTQAAPELLADGPRPPGCVALAGEQSVYRVRVGDYRILYEVIDARLLTHVVRAAHRREA